MKNLNIFRTQRKGCSPLNNCLDVLKAEHLINKRYRETPRRKMYMRVYKTVGYEPKDQLTLYRNLRTYLSPQQVRLSLEELRRLQLVTNNGKAPNPKWRRR